MMLIFAEWGNQAGGGKSGAVAGATPISGEQDEPKDSMIDERESEGTGLISNEFQVEVSNRHLISAVL